MGATLLWLSALLEPGRTCNIVVTGFGSWFLGVHLGPGLTGVRIAYALDEWGAQPIHGQIYPIRG